MIKIIFLTILSWSGPDAAKDSLRMESIDGKMFIIHQVGDHETLYRISKRYGTPIVSILEYNPTADATLEIGQILKIPYVAKTKAITSNTSEGTVHKVQAKETLYSISKLYNVSFEELRSWNNLKDDGLSLGQEIIVKKRSATTRPAKEPDIRSAADKHTVEPKETLYAISKKYGISVQQLKDWNSIQGNEVKPGDVLIVAAPKTAQNNYSKPSEKVPVTEKPIVVDSKPVAEKPYVPENKPVVSDNKPVTADVSRDNTNSNTITISEGVRGSDEVKEGGLAELIEGTEGNRKYLALHRTAKVGTIMKVRNELNNREVFVRVVGSLPSTGINDKIVIKISKSAYDRLGAIDARFRTEVTYYK